MSAELDNLTKEVAETKASMAALIGVVQTQSTLIQQLRDAATDPAAITALSGELDAAQAEAQAAIDAANALIGGEPPADPGSGPVIA